MTDTPIPELIERLRSQGVSHSLMESPIGSVTQSLEYKAADALESMQEELKEWEDNYDDDHMNRDTVESLQARVKELVYKVDVLEDRIEECQMRGPCKIPPEPPE